MRMFLLADAALRAWLCVQLCAQVFVPALAHTQTYSLCFKPLKHTGWQWRADDGCDGRRPAAASDGLQLWQCEWQPGHDGVLRAWAWDGDGQQGSRRECEGDASGVCSVCLSTHCLAAPL